MPTRYRFADFVLSPRQRTLRRGGHEVPLIPRYFDLLVLLVRRRHDAVHRNDIFAAVWPDVVVSDGALTQAVRALRRALDDDPREPRFIRTLSRHGYRFICADVTEEPDEGPLGADAAPAAVNVHDTPSPRGDERPAAGPVDGTTPAATDDVEALLACVCDAASLDESRREAAERLHTLGTARVLAQLGSRPGAARAAAWLRETRWDVPAAGAVPVWGHGGPAAVSALVALRARHAWRIGRDRWLTATLGASLAGAVAGALGGAGLALAPGTGTPATAAVVLGVLGASAAAMGAMGIAGGITAAEALARSARSASIATLAAVGGALAGGGSLLVLRWMLDDLLGVRPVLGTGFLEGLAMGAACGAGYALATRRLPGGGMAVLRGAARVRAALLVGGCCAGAALLLAAAHRPMVGGVVNAIAAASRAPGLSLAPLARVLGEPDFGPLTAAVAGAIEGAAFGFGLTIGLARRPRAHRRG